MTMSIPSSTSMLEKGRRRRVGRQLINLGTKLVAAHRRRSDGADFQVDELDRSRRSISCSSSSVSASSGCILLATPDIVVTPIGGILDAPPPEAEPVKTKKVAAFDPSEYDYYCLDGSRNTASTVGTCSSHGVSHECGEIENSAASADIPPPQQSSRVGVTFSTVTIREYPIILGDNPSVTSGPPLTLDWAHDASTVAIVSIDEYESTKPPPRDKVQMLVPHLIREDWLREAGHSRGEITEACEEVKRIKAGRTKSAAQSRRRGSMEFIREEVMESFSKMRRRCST